MNWLTEKLRNPVVAGLAIGGVGTISFLIARRLVKGDGWGPMGDVCPVEIYTNELGNKTGTRAWNYMPWLRHAANHFGVDPTLLAGLVQTESNWNPTVGSSAGALGLTQHIKSTALSRYNKLVEKGEWPFKQLKETDDAGESWFAEHGAPMRIDRTDPKQSLWFGASTLGSLLKSGHGVEWALAAYNGGPGVANKPHSEWPDETKGYVPGVLKRQKHYKDIEAACFGGIA